MPSNSPVTFRTPSTSRPSMVSLSARTSGVQSKSTYCLSQLRVSFISILNLSEPTPVHGNIFKQFGDNSRFQFFQFLGELVAVNQINRRCAVANGFFECITRK